MPGVKIDSRGIINDSSIGTCEVAIPLTVSNPLTVSGAFNLDASNNFKIGTSGTLSIPGGGAAGLIVGHGVLSGAADSAILFQITGTVGQQARCAIQLWSTASGLVAGGGTLDAGAGVRNIPSQGSIFIYTDGLDLFMVASDGNRRKFHTTGSA